MSSGSHTHPDLEARLSAAEAASASLGARLVSLEGAVVAHGSRLADAEGLIAALRSGAQAHEARLTALESRVTALEASCGNPVPPAEPFTASGVPNYRGMAFVGASSNGDAAFDVLQAGTGGFLGIRRHFARPGREDSAVARCGLDVAEGRVSWVSFKPPHSWEDMAAGAGDEWAADLAQRLGALGGPVWVTVHHEPEGDGDLAAWVAMQRRIAPIFRQVATVAYAVILTGWNQVFGTYPGRSFDALLGPVVDVVDVAGIDPYLFYGTQNSDSASPSETWTELRAYYAPLTEWLALNAPNVKWAVAETGYSNVAAEEDPNWLVRATADLIEYGGVALCYFHVAPEVYGGHPSKRWPIETPKKVEAMTASVAMGTRLGAEPPA